MTASLLLGIFANCSIMIWSYCAKQTIRLIRNVQIDCINWSSPVSGSCDDFDGTV